MKRIVRTALAAVALLLFAPMMNAQTDQDGHVLAALWKKYDAAAKADRPQTEAEILSQIKAEAIRQHLATDFYDAATKYVETVQRRDWKKREELRKGLRQEVEDFADPLVTFLWMGDWNGASSDARWAYVKDRTEAFRTGHNPALYRGIGGLMGGAMKDFVASDYEYALWSLLGSRRYGSLEKDELYQALQAEVAGKYPGEGYLAYYAAGRLYSRVLRKPAMEKVAQQYAGKAVSLWPRKDLLQIEFEDLNEDKKAVSNDYRALYEKCLAYEKERTALQGTEAKIAGGIEAVKSLSNTLTSKDLDVRVDGKKAVVTFRNLEKATLTLRLQDKTVRAWNLKNPTGSFYVVDTVRVALPVLGDGSYQLEAVNGKYSDIAWYNQHTLSLATRKDSRGFTAYVADYISGKPLDKAKLILWKGDREVASETVSLDGFTLLPRRFRQLIDNNKDTYYSLSAEIGSGTALRASGKGAFL